MTTSNPALIFGHNVGQTPRRFPLPVMVARATRSCDDGSHPSSVPDGLSAQTTVISFENHFEFEVLR